jgi:hypothetical protein
MISVIWPRLSYTRARWSSQHPAAQENPMVVDLQDILSEKEETRVLILAWSMGVKLTPSRRYRFSHRLVDFGMTKVLSTILELDLRCDTGPYGGFDGQDIPFLSLISDPIPLGGSTPILRRCKFARLISGQESEIGEAPPAYCRVVPVRAIRVSRFDSGRGLLRYSSILYRQR